MRKVGGTGTDRAAERLPRHDEDVQGRLGGEWLLETRELPVSSLRPWPGNPRFIEAEALVRLGDSLASDPAMMAARPLIARSDGTVICGNQRLLAARQLGWQTIPVLIVELDDERAALWALRDNNQYGVWDEPALAELLGELAAGGVELALTGFAGGEIDRILAGIKPVAEPDLAPDLSREDPQSQPGQIYELGQHRLACGDARDGELLQRLIGAERPGLLWTDPPYGVNYVGKTDRALRIRNDDGDASVLLVAVLQAVDPLLAPASAFYIATPAGPNGSGFRLALDQVGWHHRQTLVWVKNSFVLGHGDYHYQHEEILYGHLPGPGRPGRGRHPGSRWQGGNDQASVFFVDRPVASQSHPTMKPVALIEAMLQNSSRRDESVLDVFAGSGSTLIACERLGRRCYAVEADPGYCDVIRRRHQDYCDGR